MSDLLQRIAERTRRQRLRRSANVAIAVGVLALVVLLAWVVLSSPWLTVRTVEVEGVDVGEVLQHVAELGGGPLQFLGGEVQAGEPGDVGNVVGREAGGHKCGGYRSDPYRPPPATIGA